MDTNLPATTATTGEASATTGEASTAIVEAAAPAPGPVPQARRQRLSVAFLPLALVTFVILAIIIAAWTFLSAAT
jgi:hypothetical protein